jgi:FkbH-like protein
MQPPTLRDIGFEDIVLYRRKVRTQLLARVDLKDIRIAVLGGTTTNELVDFVEIRLLQDGFRPIIHQSEYGRFFEDAVFDPESIADLKPDLVYIHTCWANIAKLPPVSCNESAFPEYVQAELSRYRAIWTSLNNTVGCHIIQNNFDLPPTTVLGNLDAVSPGGRTRFVNELNQQFALEARSNPRLTLQDLNGISARMGYNQWFDSNRWFSYKIANTVEASFEIASSLAALVRAIYGRTRKVLVLDLDNTLWGGVIGDDGRDKIVLGHETPIAEAYTAFQSYCLSLRERGILLAVCSKNEESVAKEGFSHPDSTLKLEHFSAFKANWEPKHENILIIAQELNLDAGSFVFVDDNPAERALVEAQIPGIAVPDVGDDVTNFAAIIEAKRYFELVALGAEDLKRASFYEENSRRADIEKRFANYDEYLDSLGMTAEIGVFNSTYVERIAQLTNKSNQFNLTTRRYTLAQIESTVCDGSHIGIYGRLSDHFGDNGLISVVLGTVNEHDLHLDLWLMSCRVLKRDMEIAMLDALARRAKIRHIESLIGYYLPTQRNAMVADHYQKLGFSLISKDESTGSSVWSLDITNYHPRSRHIRIVEPVNE